MALTIDSASDLVPSSLLPLRWAVVGGGMLGLTVAHRLAQQGQQVTLYEGAAELGGLASAWKLGDVTWDRHYHVTLLSDTYLRKLLTELDLEHEINWVETKTGFYTDGHLYSMSNTLEFLRFPPLRFLEKLRLGFTIFMASRRRNGLPLEKVQVADWLRRWSGKGVFEKIWLPLLRAKLGENYRNTSAAFIWATIARMAAARRTGLKKEMFGYVPGGYARVLDTFAKKLESEHVQVRLGSPVHEISAVKQQLFVQTPTGEAESYDRVVVTAPSSLVARICPQLDERERGLFDGVEYQGILCASLLLKKPLASYYVTNITDAWVPFTAVIEMTALVDRSEFGGRSLVYLPKYVAAHDGAFDRDDESYREEYLTALERMYPHFCREDVLAFRVSRVRNVMPLATLNYSKHLPPIQTSVPGLFTINSAHIVNGTLNVNETIKLAEEAYARYLMPELRPASSVHV